MLRFMLENISSWGSFILNILKHHCRSLWWARRMLMLDHLAEGCLSSLPAADSVLREGTQRGPWLQTSLRPGFPEQKKPQGPFKRAVSATSSRGPPGTHLWFTSHGGRENAHHVCPWGAVKEGSIVRSGCQVIVRRDQGAEHCSGFGCYLEARIFFVCFSGRTARHVGS